LVELALASKQEPQITGELLYQSWTAQDQSAVIGLRIGRREQFLLVDGRLLIAALPRDLALRTWLQQFPAEGVATAVDVPFITDAYLLRTAGRKGNRIWAEIDFLPGEHSLTVLAPAQPAECQIDGAKKEFHFDARWHSVNLAISTPETPVTAIDIRHVQTSVERFDSTQGEWISGPARVLEDIGPVPYGYVRYRAQVVFNGEGMMYISSFTDNDKQVFLNGKHVAEASKPGRFIAFAPAAYLHPGDNLLEISYELFGSTEFGEEERMAEPTV
jgi:hypothetical protein